MSKLEFLNIILFKLKLKLNLLCGIYLSAVCIYFNSKTILLQLNLLNLKFRNYNN